MGEIWVDEHTAKILRQIVEHEGDLLSLLSQLNLDEGKFRDFIYEMGLEHDSCVREIMDIFCLGDPETAPVHTSAANAPAADNNSSSASRGRRKRQRSDDGKKKDKHGEKRRIPQRTFDRDEFRMGSADAFEEAERRIANASSQTEKSLDLAGLGLVELPSEISDLMTLESLDLSNNRLVELPAKISRLERLTSLNLDGNPLSESYAKTFKEGGIEALFSLLRGLADAASPLYEAKLLVTGEGAVGKSWALAALKGKNPKEAVGKQTTYGIDRGSLPLEHPSVDGTTITLNTWDFGGQQVYRVTHQFFFSEEAIFLLVWNPRQGAEQCQVREWLRRIELRTGGDAKVIMVASHSPKEKMSYQPDYHRDDLPKDLRDMIVDETAIDSARKADGSEDENVQVLREMIAKHVAELPTMGDPFPKNWQKARDATLARRDDDPYITYSEFGKICKKEGVTGPDQVYTLARVFMHRLGRAVYYGERRPEGEASAAKKPVYQDAMLADIMVLDAEWLSKAFVRVLDDEETKRAGGVLDHARLDVIWRTHGRKDWSVYHPVEHQYLIRLMAAFDVSYVVKTARGEKSLVTQLVPNRPPDLPWFAPSGSDNLPYTRMVCMPGILGMLENEVPGLMARFIVQTASYHIVDGTGRGQFWTNGVFLREPAFGNEALIEIVGTERPVVTLSVRGPQPGWFLSELYRTLDTLFEFWPGLRKSYHVLCPNVRDDGELCTGQFEFDFLVAEQKEHPHDNQICQICRSRWKPRDLLFGYDGVAQQRERDMQAAHERF